MYRIVGCARFTDCRGTHNVVCVSKHSCYCKQLLRDGLVHHPSPACRRHAGRRRFPSAGEALLELKEEARALQRPHAALAAEK
jgi:hypothetical protein